MRAGLLRHLVTIEGPPIVRTPDGHGGYTETATPMGPIRASVKPMSAANIERILPVQVQGVATHLVECRYLAGVTLQSVVVLQQKRRLHVKGIQNPDERNERLVLACEERI